MRISNKVPTAIGGRLTNADVSLMFMLIISSFGAFGKCPTLSTVHSTSRSYDVITAKVISMEQGTGECRYYYSEFIFTVDIDFSFAHKLKGITKIYVGGDCGITPEVGKHYLLFIHSCDAHQFTHMCDDNEILGHSGGSIAVLNNLFCTNYQVIKPDFIIFITMIMLVLSGLSWMITRRQFHFRLTRDRKKHLRRVSVIQLQKNDR